MNSTQIKLKKFLGNRNTVTILCAIIGIAVLYIGYTMKINSAIQPVQVPYANDDIQPREKITEDDISYMQVAKAALDKMKGDVLTNKNDIINHYAAINTLIPKGSLFYTSAVVKERQHEPVYEIKKDQVLTYFKVGMDTSYVNSILPGSYMDIYASVVDPTTQQPIVGTYIEDVKVLAVKTSDGLNVFENTDEVRQPAYIMFAVNRKEFYNLLKCTRLNVVITPVPTGRSAEEVEEESKMVSEDFEDYIESRANEFDYTGRMEGIDITDGTAKIDDNKTDTNTNKNNNNQNTQTEQKKNN